MIPEVTERMMLVRKSGFNLKEIANKLKQVCGTSDKLALLLSGGDVRRYHQEGHVYCQPVSEHTWRVLVILLHFFPDASRHLMEVALYHDTPERFTGDAPATVKEADEKVRKALEDMESEFLEFLGIPGEADLHNLDYFRLKCADYIELCITVKYQHGRRASQIYERGRKLVGNYVKELPMKDQKLVRAFMRDLHSDKWEA